MAPGQQRRGRPPGTSCGTLEVVALRLFIEHGFHETTVEQIADAAGVSSRTFFRYFDSNADVLWNQYEQEVDALRKALAAVDDKVPLTDAIRTAVIEVKYYTPGDLSELRTRINLISSVSALQASAAVHYDAWESVIREYAARRLRQQPTSLLPLSIGRATLAVCRAAYEVWLTRGDGDLTTNLDQAITALANGFPGGSSLWDQTPAQTVACYLATPQSVNNTPRGSEACLPRPGTRGANRD